MPFIEINHASLYYEILGEDVPGKVPILLIHGSTVTGQTDWGIIAPLLARSWRVIVPDCRGHGKSSNPAHTYSFREMADDMAALLGSLGYSKAHVIGHSNGGNVALVTLIEHPEVVQTAILQAANAYVSADLLEREPLLFDPERVARQRPEWMEEMISLHGPTHGREYWRDLLELTLKETISQPNYTPEELQQVRRPTLVIQGEKDGANAPGRHAQFMARYIPHAELWIPTGVGHNVHIDLPFEWIERMSDFLERRGDSYNDALYWLGQERYPDRRVTVFDLHAQVVPSTQGETSGVNLAGRVLTADQLQAARDCCATLTPSSSITLSVEQARVLLDDATPWVLINRPVDDLRREPRLTSERVSQALLGESARLIEARDDWSYIRHERDGYLGWIHTAAVHRCPKAVAVSYQPSCKAKVAVDFLPFWAEKPSQREETVIAGRLPFGVCLMVEEWDSGQAWIHLPDMHSWWVPSDGLLPLDQCPKPDGEGIDFTLKLIRRFTGVPYLWGGRTPYGFDCSGFTQAFWGFMGVSLPRDADQQFQAGMPVDGTPEPGDLLFFGEAGDDQPEKRFASISHVAISLGGDHVIHSNGTAWGVSYNSLNPEHPGYRAWLRDNLVGVRRFGQGIS